MCGQKDRQTFVGMRPTFYSDRPFSAELLFLNLHAFPVCYPISRTALGHWVSLCLLKLWPRWAPVLCLKASPCSVPSNDKLYLFLSSLSWRARVEPGFRVPSVWTLWGPLFPPGKNCSVSHPGSREGMRKGAILDAGDEQVLKVPRLACSLSPTVLCSSLYLAPALHWDWWAHLYCFQTTYTASPGNNLFSLVGQGLGKGFPSWGSATPGRFSATHLVSVSTSPGYLILVLVFYR